ncbi:MAG: helix-turn-helix transcriptional regulator [Reichenbachiella sp.]|uniref:helix-turn-helix domain-containing protein n=1 Tax=Reichenbachiella sp. TaxID=2184521 RepID=UPI003265002C
MAINQELSIKFGKQVRRLREARGLSSADASRLLLMDRSNWSRIETGKTNITISTMNEICKKLNITFQELFEEFNHID